MKIHPVAFRLAVIVTLVFAGLIAVWFSVIRISSGIPHQHLSATEEAALLQTRGTKP